MSFVSHASPTIASFAIAVLLSACAGNLTSGAFPTIASSVSAPVAAASATADPFAAVLARYGWTPQGEPTIQLFLVPETTKPPFLVALQASQAIGMDFSSWQGQTVNQRTYLLGREPKANMEVSGVLLTDGERVVGARLFVKGQYPGVHPLTARLADLVSGPP